MASESKAPPVDEETMAAATAPAKLSETAAAVDEGLVEILEMAKVL